MSNGFFAKLTEGLSKTKDGVVKGINNVLSSFTSVDEDFYEELEETLIMGDIGINATSRIMDKLREQVRDRHITDTQQCRELLISNIREQMRTDDNAYDFENYKTVIFVIGVNGVGKTTSVGKLAAHFRKKGRFLLQLQIPTEQVLQSS